MIAKKLIHFNEKNAFESRKEDIKDSSIVFIKETNEIYTHGESYNFVGWSYLTLDVPEGYNLFMLPDGSQFVDSDNNEFLTKDYAI